MPEDNALIMALWAWYSYRMQADNSRKDSPEYLSRKQFYDSLLTIYGRKPILEALQDTSIPVFRLHLADSNQPGSILAKIENLAEGRGIEVVRHSRDQLSRISRNRKQDQGVAADLQCPEYRPYRTFLENAASTGKAYRLMALDRITNPQNLGMIIRSVCASPLDGLLLPTQGCAPLSPLVIKASAGTLFRCPILRCNDLAAALENFRRRGADVCVLSSNAEVSLRSLEATGSTIFVLGNETTGVSTAVARTANLHARIPMERGVESLNVAIAAALIAFGTR